jgi:hypothetical protein
MGQCPKESPPAVLLCGRSSTDVRCNVAHAPSVGTRLEAGSKPLFTLFIVAFSLERRERQKVFAYQIDDERHVLFVYKPDVNGFGAE